MSVLKKRKREYASKNRKASKKRKVIVDSFCPKDKNEWRKWLEMNHKKKDSIWLIYYKKKSPKHNLSWSQAVDQAICFGWIDSVKKGIDDEKFKQYFSKRKPKSNWSKVNKNKVKNLTKQGLMKKAGLKSIEIAKKNGSWTILDDVEELIIPEDLKEQFSNYKGSLNYFDNLSKSQKKGLLYWIVSAKRPNTRKKRILEIAENAGRGKKPKQFR